MNTCVPPKRPASVTKSLTASVHSVTSHEQRGTEAQLKQRKHSASQHRAQSAIDLTACETADSLSLSAATRSLHTKLKVQQSLKRYVKSVSIQHQMNNEKTQENQDEGATLIQVTTTGSNKADLVLSRLMPGQSMEHGYRVDTMAKDESSSTASAKIDANTTSVMTSTLLWNISKKATMPSPAINKADIRQNDNGTTRAPTDSTTTTLHPAKKTKPKKIARKATTSTMIATAVANRVTRSQTRGLTGLAVR